MRMKLKPLVLSVCWFTILVLIIMNMNPVRYNERSEYNAKAKYQSDNETQLEGLKKILIWTDFFYAWNVWPSIFKRLSSGECEESRCLFTLNKMETLSADAVLFYAYNLRNTKGLEFGMVEHIFPLPFEFTRTPDQMYIFYSMEPPIKLDTLYLANMPKNYFNWTMGYRRDSDIFEPFGVVKKRESGKTEVRYVTQEELRQKKFSVWIGSSCFKRAPFLRENFLLALKEKIAVDAFGDCGIRCDNASRLEIYGREIGEPACEAKIKDYVFYLALENSLCKDYVTEKIFKAWKLGAIPVVFGGGNYSRVAPPNSYIDYRDFDSVSDLTNYMIKVASDSKLYNRYFKWKEDYNVDVGAPYKPLICDLCKKLYQHSIHRQTKSYPDIHDWFVRKGNCKTSVRF